MKRQLCLWLLLYITSISYQCQAHPSWGLVKDSEGNFYFADIMHNGMGSLWKLDTQGKFHLLLSDFHAHNVNLDSNGQVVSAHGEDNHTMLRIRTNGELDTLYHTLDLQQFFGGNCAYGPSGNIYFSIDKYIWKIDPSGEKSKVSDQQLEWNQTIFVNNNGTIYAPDIGIGRGVIYEIRTDGSARIIADSLIAQLGRPRDKHNDVLLGIQQDDFGNIYVAELAGKRIIKIDTSRNQSDYYISKDDWFPTGICFADKQMYLLEYQDTPTGTKGPRISTVNQAGEHSVIFNYDPYQVSDGEVPSKRSFFRGFWYLLIFIIILAFVSLKRFFIK